MPSVYLLGTDEAGYGPSLGPLVIAASLWQVEVAEAEEEVDLYARLTTGVTDTASDKSGRVAIADSKQLYSAGERLAALERGLLSALALLDKRCTLVPELFEAVGARWDDSLPWQTGHVRSLPVDGHPAEIIYAAAQWRNACQIGKVTLLDLRAKVIQPAEFNDGCRRFGNKAGLLSTTTLSLVRDLIAARTAAPMRILCDKHGGRNAYAPLLVQELLQYELPLQPLSLRTLVEGRAESAYRWQLPHSLREIRFVAKGERFLPAALASMLAKYLRELSMAAWNAYWREQLPALAPTAGYPQDAKRFRAEIESTAQRLGHAAELWWRER